MYNVGVVSEHIPGCENVAADALSRNDTLIFRSQVLTAAENQTEIPPPATSQALVHEQPDWTLESWRRVLIEYFSKGLTKSTQQTYWNGQKK